MNSDTDFNPRFVAYAKSLGQSATEAHAKCMARPVGKMMPFILWINSKWSEWKRLNRREPYATVSTVDHKAFDAWLQAEVAA